MNKTKLQITLLITMIWSFFSVAQQYTNYSTKNGLPSNHVYRITQDVDGFIWFITDKGMVKFNGTNFKTITIRDGLPVNDIWNIVATPNGRVWYFSKSPKIGYIDKDSIYSFPSAFKGEILNPMNRNIVGNDITFNNSLAHYQLESKQWKPYDVSGSYSKIKRYKSFLNHTKLHRFEFSVDKSNLLFLNKNNDTINKIKSNQQIEDSHTRGQVNDSTYIWLSDKSYSVLNLNKQNLKTTFFKNVINIEKSKYVRMHVVNNQVQITGVGFVSILDKGYNLTNTYYIPKNLKAHFSFVDRQDNLWLATFTNGVYKLPKSKQNTVYTLKNEKVGKIKKVNNRLLTTVLNKGFYKYDSITKQFTPFIKDSNYSYGVFDITELNKQYFITDNKITTIENAKKTTQYALKATNLFNEIARQLVYHKNYLYGNFTSGLNKLTTDNLSISKQYSLNGIRTFVSFKNELIIGSSNGLKILKNDTIEPINFKNIIPNKLYKKPILSLNKLDDNSLLVGTDSYGAFITDLDKIIHLKETEFLSINHSFIENDNLWLATNKGVWYYKKNKNNNYSFVTNYNINDGLLLNNVKSVYATGTNLIISSNIGVVTIPKKKQEELKLLGVYVDKIKFDNKELLSNSTHYTNNNTVSFNVATIDFSEKLEKHYQYQLQPLQSKWISTTSKQISFNELPPNKYTLLIKANDKQNEFSFKITPLWYQTLLAKIVFGILISSFLLGLILFMRKRELKKQEKKLMVEKKLADFELHALRSQMNPHFVFNSLNAIQYYITKNEIDLSEKYLVKFSRLIRMFFDFSSDKEITLNQEINLLKGYLEIEKMRFGEEFKYDFIIDNKLNIQKQVIPTMLLQPIVENAVNHGVFHNQGKGVVEIVFNYINKNTYKVIITDDGIGMKRSKEIQQKSLKNLKSKLHSTQILKERLELLNRNKIWDISYKLTSDLSDDKGTSVQLIFTKNG